MRNNQKNKKKKEQKQMKNKNEKLTRKSKITSTSDLTLEDIVDFVAGELPHEPCRNKIEGIVHDTLLERAIELAPLRVRNTAHGGRTDGGMPEGCFRADTDMVADITASRRKIKGKPHTLESAKWYGIALQNGEVWTPYTSRRFLPAQYLRLMKHSNGNIDAGIARRYSMQDFFKLFETEVEKLIFMQRNWYTSFVERSRFLTVDDCRAIIHQYLNAVSSNINDKTKCMHKRRKNALYRKIPGAGTVVLWTTRKTTVTGDSGFVKTVDCTEPTLWLTDFNAAVNSAQTATDSARTYEDILKVIRKMPKIGLGMFRDSEGQWRNWLPKYWKNCFKKQGAYYTLKALIVNRYVHLTTESGTWRNTTKTVYESGRDGLNELKKLSDPKVPAYVVHAILKKSISEAGLVISDFLERIARKR